MLALNKLMLVADGWPCYDFCAVNFCFTFTFCPLQLSALPYGSL